MDGERTAGRFRLREEIGRGRRAVVQAAYDVVLEREVALKRAATPADDELLLEEARRLARLSHPAILRLHDVVLGPPVQLVLERLHGVTLRELLVRTPRLPLPKVASTTRELLEALHAVHTAGLVHGDVKPENLFLCEPGGALRLLDLGALGDATALYAAPETSFGGAAEPGADLYATGVVVFEMLCGRPPFDAASAAELAARKRTQRAPSARSAGASAPPAVEAWLARCLDPDPERRFPDAGAALAEWRAATGDEVRGPTALDPPLVLHSGAWAGAVQLLDDLGAGRGGVASVWAERGMGKSVLLAQWLEAARERGLGTLWLRMPGGARRRPYTAWRAAVRDGCAPLRLPLPRASRPGDEEAVAERAVRAIEKGAVAVAVAIDAPESFDGASRRLALRLAQVATRTRVAVLVATDSGARGRAAEEVRSSLATSGGRVWELLPPPVEAWRPLVARLLGGGMPSDALVLHVRSRSGGNLRAAAALLAALEGRGALQRTGEAWVFRSELAPDVLPAPLEAQLADRLRGLDEREREILELAAVQGERLSAGLLAARLGGDPLVAIEALQKLDREHRILRRDGSDWSFREPLLCAWLHDRMAPERARAEHEAVCRALEAAAASDPAVLGRHLVLAGRAVEALPLLETAAAQAAASHDDLGALGLLDLAVGAAEGQVVDEPSAERRVRLGLERAAALRGLAAWQASRAELDRIVDVARAWGLEDGEADVLTAQGDVEYAQSRFAQAIERWTEAQAATARRGDDDARHEIALKIGNVHFERGDLALAAEQYERVLAFAARGARPEMEARAAHNVALVESIQGRKESAVAHFNRSLERFLALGRRDAVARIYHNIGQIYLELGNWAEARNFFQRSMEECEKSGQEALLGIACLDGAEASFRLGDHAAATAALERALARSRERGDEVGTASAYRLQAALAAAAGDVATAEARLLESIGMLQHLGQALQLGLGWKELGAVRLQAGRPAAAAEALAQARRVFAALDAAEPAAAVEALWARCQEALACRP